MKGLIVLLFTLIFFAGCNTDKVPVGIIPKDSMITLLTDIHLADGYLNTVHHDSLKQYTGDLHFSIFKKHRTDSSRFRKSVEYYAKKPEEFQAMYETIKVNLDTLQKELLKEEEKIRR